MEVVKWDWDYSEEVIQQSFGRPIGAKQLLREDDMKIGRGEVKES